MLINDPVCSYSLREAIEVGRVMEELGFLWLEEPFYEQELAQYQTLCAELKTMPVMATEMLMYDVTLCAQWLIAGATDLVRVNARNGATGVVKLAHLAELHGTTVEMNAGGGLGGHVHVQLQCALAATQYFEHFGGHAAQGEGERDHQRPSGGGRAPAPLHAARVGGGAGLGLHPLPHRGRVLSRAPGASNASEPSDARSCACDEGQRVRGGSGPAVSSEEHALRSRLASAPPAACEPGPAEAAAARRLGAAAREPRRGGGRRAGLAPTGQWPRRPRQRSARGARAAVPRVVCPRQRSVARDKACSSGGPPAHVHGSRAYSGPSGSSGGPRLPTVAAVQAKRMTSSPSMRTS